MPTRFAPWLLATSLVPLILASCSDDGDDDTAADGSTESTTETSGDGDGDPTGDGDPSTGDGDGDPGTGDGDGDDCPNPVLGVELQRQLAWTGTFPNPIPEMDSLELMVDSSGIGGDERIYLYADYDMAGFNFLTQFQYLTLDLHPEGCAINLVVDIADLELVSLPIVDVSSGETVDVAQAELGGGPEGMGINVWDITDIELQDEDCGSSPLFSISYNPMETYTALWSYMGVDAEVRELRIYEGAQTEQCP